MPSPPLPSLGLCWDSAVDETAAVLEQDISNRPLCLPGRSAARQARLNEIFRLGPSFCWGPALEGPTSPSSSCSSTPSKLDKIDAGCAARAPCTPPARAPATPPAPRADPTPSRRRALTPLCSAARAGTNYLSRRGAEEDPPHNLRRADDPPTGRRCRRRPRRRPRRRLRPRRPRRRPLQRAVVLAKIDALQQKKEDL